MMVSMRSSDFAVLPGYPADHTVDHDGMPAVGRGSDIRKDGPVLDSGDAGVVSAVALADIHRSAAAHDGDLCGSGNGLLSRLLSGLFLGLRIILFTLFTLSLVSGLLTLRRAGLISLLSFVIIGDSAHQRGMGLIAIQPILLESGLLLEGFHGGLSLAAEVTINSQRRTQLI